MEHTITEDAVLQCNMGTTPSQLSVTSQQFFSIEDKFVATEKDKEPIQNIKPFGKCKLKPTAGGYLPCVPSPECWKQTSNKNKINEALLLLDTSICTCSIGGTITIKDKGYTGDNLSD